MRCSVIAHAFGMRRQLKNARQTPPAGPRVSPNPCLSQLAEHESFKVVLACG